MSARAAMAALSAFGLLGQWRFPALQSELIAERIPLATPVLDVPVSPNITVRDLPLNQEAFAPNPDFPPVSGLKHATDPSPELFSKWGIRGQRKTVDEHVFSGAIRYPWGAAIYYQPTSPTQNVGRGFTEVAQLNSDPRLVRLKGIESQSDIVILYREINIGALQRPKGALGINSDLLGFSPKSNGSNAQNDCEKRDDKIRNVDLKEKSRDPLSPWRGVVFFLGLIFGGIGQFLAMSDHRLRRFGFPMLVVGLFGGIFLLCFV